ncbi:MAG: conjugal transfer protein [Solirubrobacteraceae bacterium]
MSLTRWVLYVVAAVGVAATVRFSVAPPAGEVDVRPAPAADDLGGEWFVEQFARAYLTWGYDPSTRDQAMAPFVGPLDDPSLGVRPATGSRQDVAWLDVVARRSLGDGTWQDTVAVQTTTHGLLYLDVDVASAGPRYVLVNYPAIVASPSFAAAGALDGANLPAVSNPALEAVLARALGNYLSGSTQNLAADLTANADVTPPRPALVLDTIQRLAVEPTGEILVTVVAHDRWGDSYTLAYTVAVVLRSGRWEISSINAMAS